MSTMLPPGPCALYPKKATDMIVTASVFVVKFFQADILLWNANQAVQPVWSWPCVFNLVK